MVLQKKCILCNQLKSISSFKNMKKLGFKSVCKKCNIPKNYPRIIELYRQKNNKSTLHKPLNNGKLSNINDPTHYRKCTTCGISKPETDYYTNHYNCKKCHRVYTAISSRDISREDYLDLEKIQKGKCWICGEEEKTTRDGKIRKLSIDHNHETGKVRALLCNNCNFALGLVKEDILILRKMIKYIRIFNQPNTQHGI